ncbi:MAG: transaldolase [Pseudomonadota bacterium]
MPSKLDQLRAVTTVVADTGDLDAIKAYAPQDATTNPSLLLKAAASDTYRPLIDAALASETVPGIDPIDSAIESLSVLAGLEILKVIPGRVSTEVSAALSYDTAATVAAAHRLIERYAAHGVGTERVLIKIAATWEGIRAAEQLERAGIQCNMTLLFSLEQALACADAGAYLISPFVGRITDYFKKAQGVDGFAPADDPGVASVQRIFRFYNACGYETVVMGASFRNQGQIEALAGIDLLTISPDLLEGLAADPGELAVPLQRGPVTLTEAESALVADETLKDESRFAAALQANAMAADRLHDGIERFAADQRTLAEQLRTL